MMIVLGRDGGVSHVEWVAEVRELYEELSREIGEDQDLCLLRGVCCDFRVMDHRLYATGVEVEFLLRHVAPRAAEGEGLCPFWRGGRCTVHALRPLGCRTYFCAPSWRARGEELHARYHRRLAAIGERAGIPYRYGPWVPALAVRTSPEAPVSGDGAASGSCRAGERD